MIFFYLLEEFNYVKNPLGVLSPLPVNSGRNLKGTNYSEAVKQRREGPISGVDNLCSTPLLYFSSVEQLNFFTSL